MAGPSKFVFAVFAGVALGACSGAPGGADAGQEATIQPVSLRVGTWNLQEFGVDGGEPERVAGLISEQALDLIALQEVDDPMAFDRLVAALSGYEGKLADASDGDPLHRLGLVWRSARIDVPAMSTVFLDRPDVFPRPVLQASIDVRLEPERLHRFALFAVHLKAGVKPPDEDRRIQAMVLLEQQVRGVLDTGEDELLVLGDFNEAFSDPRAAEVFAPWTGDPEQYRVLTAPLADAGVVSFLPANILLDHAVATAGLDAERDGAAPFVPRLDQTVADYRTALSDHLPVLLDLRFVPE